MMWANFFRDGGWGMYPTSLFGFVLVAASVLLVLRPERRYVRLVASLGALTLGVAETMTATYISPRWATMVPYVVIMVVLLVRPQGLMGAKLREDVVV